MKYALFIYFDKGRKKLAFEGFYASVEDATDAVDSAYESWVHSGGDACGLHEWAKDYELYKIVEKLT